MLHISLLLLCSLHVTTSLSPVPSLLGRPLPRAENPRYVLHMSSASSILAGLEMSSALSGGELEGTRSSGLGMQGLSKYHQSILSRMANERQRFVSGKYPVICEVTDTPTLKWLGRGKTGTASTSQLMVNGTSVQRSLASYDRFQWLDDEEREELHNGYGLLSWELLAVISLPKPGYVNILPGHGAGSTAASARFLESNSQWGRWKFKGQVLEELEERVCKSDRLWVTGFSLTGRSGTIHSVDADTGYIGPVNARTSRSLLWPNEVTHVPSQFYASPDEKADAASRINGSPLCDLKDAILVSDGFLVPGKDRGGIHVVKNPGNPNSEWSVCLTEITGYDKWFYHRAVWIDLTGDGRKSILTARAKSPLGSSNSRSSTDYQNESSGKKPMGQLVCLEMPKPYRVDEKTGTPLEKDGTVFDPLSLRHLPWKQHVLDEGPDVMFNIVDMDQEDDTVEVISSQFFGEKVTMHSIQRGPTPKVTFRRTIDDKCGKAFGCILSDLESGETQLAPGCSVIDAGSTVKSLKQGDSFSHILVTSHECTFQEETLSKVNAEEMQLKTNAFKKRNGMSHPQSTTSIRPRASQRNKSSSNSSADDGGSLFAYRIPEGRGKWKTEEWTRTTVASGFKVQGQLNNMINPGAPGFVYTFHTKREDAYAKSKKRPLIAVAGDCAESAFVFSPVCELGDTTVREGRCDPSTQYELMCEIKCGATVGSIAVGYGDICSQEQESGYAKLYIPCYEKDRILVFGLGSGDG